MPRQFKIVCAVQIYHVIVANSKHRAGIVVRNCVTGFQTLVEYQAQFILYRVKNFETLSKTQRYLCGVWVHRNSQGVLKKRVLKHTFECV